ncbi:hypothetical protein Bbelb_324470 [Branchiostoma belcheri]|nr:hypothetical protein Bbelb_338310 [Branchiostoma belcheri]KAI8489817.1 hypothetical protein Bbelb_324470 [Branchiostoma belcheri]
MPVGGVMLNQLDIQTITTDFPNSSPSLPCYQSVACPSLLGGRHRGTSSCYKLQMSTQDKALLLQERNTGVPSSDAMESGYTMGVAKPGRGTRSRPPGTTSLASRG